MQPHFREARLLEERLLSTTIILLSRTSSRTGSAGGAAARLRSDCEDIACQFESSLWWSPGSGGALHGGHRDSCIAASAARTSLVLLQPSGPQVVRWSATSKQTAWSPEVAIAGASSCALHGFLAVRARPWCRSGHQTKKLIPTGAAGGFVVRDAVRSLASRRTASLQVASCAAAQLAARKEPV